MNFAQLDYRITRNLQAIADQKKKLVRDLKLIRDNRLYLEKGYFTFKDYCNGELAHRGGYARVQNPFNEVGEQC